MRAHGMRFRCPFVHRRTVIELGPAADDTSSSTTATTSNILRIAQRRYQVVDAMFQPVRNLGHLGTVPHIVVPTLFDKTGELLGPEAFGFSRQ